MPDTCSALNCQNRYQSSGSVTFHEFPIENVELLKKWVSRMGRGSWLPSQFSKLCSEHFEAKWFINDKGKRALKPNAIPSIFTDPSYIRRRGRKKRLKRGRQSKKSASDKKQPEEEPKDSPVEEMMSSDDVPPESNSVLADASQEGSDYDSDRTTSDVADSSAPVLMLQNKLRAANLEIQRLQDSVIKWETLNEALKPENRDPFLIERLNAIQKDAALGHANSLVLLNSIMMYGKDQEQIG